MLKEDMIEKINVYVNNFNKTIEYFENNESEIEEAYAPFNFKLYDLSSLNFEGDLKPLQNLKYDDFNDLFYSYANSEWEDFIDRYEEDHSVTFDKDFTQFNRTSSYVPTNDSFEDYNNKKYYTIYNFGDFTIDGLKDELKEYTKDLDDLDKYDLQERMAEISDFVSNVMDCKFDIEEVLEKRNYITKQHDEVNNMKNFSNYVVDKLENRIEIDILDDVYKYDLDNDTINLTFISCNSKIISDDMQKQILTDIFENQRLITLKALVKNEHFIEYKNNISEDVNNHIKEKFGLSLDEISDKINDNKVTIKQEISFEK